MKSRRNKLQTLLKSSILIALLPGFAFASSVYSSKELLQSPASSNQAASNFQAHPASNALVADTKCLDTTCKSASTSPAPFQTQSHRLDRGEQPSQTVVWLLGSGLLALGLITKKRRT